MVQGNNVQKEFCNFVEKCVMGDGNLLTTTNNLFTDANIKTARDCEASQSLVIFST